jgi:hypothetical protein
LLLCAFALIFLSACGKPAAPVRYEYDEFEFQPNDYSYPGKAEVSNLAYLNPESHVWEKPDRVMDAAAVLTRIAAYGWEFTWTDGRHYLVRRPDTWTNGTFMVSRELINLPAEK